ncbi:RIMS-binding protein 3-like [Macrotis lagotis]|uniref:RIMS-binding protein 3-like n=1 Tax=Macrotis lagotis TaxID=92651 RepID=UPI003D69530F
MSQAGPSPAPKAAAAAELRRELEAVRAELEAERARRQAERRRFGTELRELREAAERERRRQAERLRSGWELQRLRELRQLREAVLRERDAEIRQLLRWKEAELRQLQRRLHRERDGAVRQARQLQRQLAEELLSRGHCARARPGARAPPDGAAPPECRCKLQDVLAKLRWETDGEQAARIRHLQAALQLERGLFLKYILDNPRWDPAARAPGRPAPPPGAPGPWDRPRSLDSLRPPRPRPAARCSRSLEAPEARSPPRGAAPSSAGLAPGGPDTGERGPREAAPPGPDDEGEEDDDHDDDDHDGHHEGGDDEDDDLGGARPPPPPGKEGEGAPGLGRGDLAKQNAELAEALEALGRHCRGLREENSRLRRGLPESAEKVRRLRLRHAELGGIAKRLEERARQLRESGAVGAPGPGDLELWRRAVARQRARDLAGQAAALLAKDRQIEELRLRCRDLQAPGAACGSPQARDLDRLLRESQKEVLRLQRQLTLQKAGSPPDQRATTPPPGPEEGAEELKRRVQALEQSLSLEQRGCESLRGDVGQAQQKCREVQGELRQALSLSAQLTQENGLLQEKARGAERLASENGQLRAELEQARAEHQAAALQVAQLQQQAVQGQGSRQQLERELRETLSALAASQAEVQRLQQDRERLQRECREARQTLEAGLRDTERPCTHQAQQLKTLQQFRGPWAQRAPCHPEGPSLMDSGPPGGPASEVDTGSEAEELEADSLSQASEPEGPRSHKGHHNRPGEDSHSSQDGHHDHQSRHSQDSHDSCNSHQSLHSHNSYQSLHSHNSHQSHRSQDSHHSQNSHQSHESHNSQDSHSSSKVKIFLARYNYDPFAGPNDQPEAELPLTAGEYIYIFGDMDEDGFYAGESMDGQRGLVPSNLVEQISDGETLNSQPPEGNDSCLDSCQEVKPPSPEGKGADSVEEATCCNLPAKKPKEDILEEALDFSGVPCPQKLTLIQQLPHAVVVDWEAPLDPNPYGATQGYNVYVDNKLWQNIQAGSQTRATIDNLELKTRAYRISVQSVMEKGCSNRLQCSFLVGGSFCPRPTQLCLRHLTPTSAEISWLYSNSNYAHMVYLNDQECNLTKAGVCWYSFHNLQPSTHYWAHVEVQLPGGPSRELWEETSSSIAFTTPSAGPPDPPLDVLVEHHTSPGTLLVSWIPVTIDSAGSSNGVPVTGYAIYMGGHKVTEVPSPTAGNVLVEFSQLQQQKLSQEVSVRTMSHYGESLDSVPAQIPGESSSYRSPQSFPIIHSCQELAHLQTPLAWRPPVPISQQKAILASSVASQGFPKDHFQKRVPKPSPEDNTNPQGPGEAHVLNLLPPNKKELQGPKTPKDGSCGNTSYLTDGQIGVEEESTRKAGPRWNQVSVIESVPENDPMKEISRDNNSGGNVPKNRVEVETLQVTSQSAEAPPDYSHLADLDNLEEEEQHVTLWGTRRPSPKEFRVQNAQTRPAGLKKEPSTLFYQVPPGKMTKILKTSPMLTASGAWFRTPGSNALKGKEASDPVRMFVALWDYDPQVMSTNPAAAEEELAFHQGQILKVWGDQDSDGFYHGECSGRMGYIPGDMVSEVQIEGSEVFKQLFQQGHIPAEMSLEGLLGLSMQPASPQKSFSVVRRTPQQAQFWHPQTMVAAFDYHPRKSSNLSTSEELTLSAGDVVTVLGSVDDNGFLYGELNGQRGLVPSNLLKMPALKAE